MSAAGRGPRLGGDKDNYPTPEWCIHRLLDEWIPRPGLLLEPCAGDGRIIQTVDSRLRPEHFIWAALEIREECRRDLSQLARRQGRLVFQITDFLTNQDLPVDTDGTLTTVISNPPYNVAEKVIRRAREVGPHADIVMLMRIGFLASEARGAFFEEHGVPDIYVLPNRPIFVKGTSDNTEYAWYIWPPVVRSQGRVFRLPVTPIEQRTLKGL